MQDVIVVDLDQFIRVFWNPSAGAYMAIFLHHSIFVSKHDRVYSDTPEKAIAKLKSRLGWR